MCYTYDPLNRLTGAYYSSGEVFEYAYDAVGNRLAMTKTTPLDETTVTTYTYDAANRLLVSHSPGHLVTYGWDDRGNLTHDGTFTYTYNAAGRMVRAQSVTATLVYTYTADGLRVGQDADGAVTTFAWDWASGLPEMLSDGGRKYLVGHETVGRWDGSGWAYHLPDALGSVRQEVDGAGVVVSTREWTPYGVEVGGAQAGLGYTGEWWDGDVGLLYLRARWYAPGEGRFTAPDPFSGLLSWPQSQNPYPYAANNPVLQADPSGEFCIPCVIAAAIGLAVFLEGCTPEPEPGLVPALVSLEVQFTTEVNIISEKWGLALELGTASEQGVKFIGVVDVPEGSEGRLEWVQNVKEKRTREHRDGRMEQRSSEGRWMLDTIDPYEVIGDFTKYPEQVTLEVEETDAPYTPLSGKPSIADLVRATADDQFRMFLMWNPSTGQRVTVGVVDWSWKATAERISNDDWIVTQQELEAEQGIATSSEEPVLWPNVTGLEWEPITP